MILRACNQTDAKALAKIERQCFSSPWSENMLLSAFSRVDFVCFVLEQAGDALGYVCGTTLFETAELARIAVLQGQRRKGLGEKLLDAFISCAKERGAQQMFLEVRESNAPAIALYEKRGFEKVRVRAKYYENGENGLEMKKLL
jgi:ribosomal-protein-alanine N-acetyltransferase